MHDEGYQETFGELFGQRFQLLTRQSTPRDIGPKDVSVRTAVSGDAFFSPVAATVSGHSDRQGRRWGQQRRPANFRKCLS